MFRADAVSGAVTASADFRPRPAYGLTATARDGGGGGSGSLVATRKVEVFMADEFAAPGFDRGAPQEAEVKEDVPVGFVVASFSSSASGDPVSFGLAGGNSLGWFSVRNITGEVVVARQLDYETARQEEVWVKVYRTGRPLFFAATK